MIHGTFYLSEKVYAFRNGLKDFPMDDKKSKDYWDYGLGKIIKPKTVDNASQFIRSKER